ncbi:bifunctional aspartate kinase homoserine dehydrogenase [Raphidocelis subcapitata]|uniref:Bifunctional aspartate kinase homoserine dehydrogenase n=1 Tax=Raphidocelis subcapitata TaxID=307507 RepID=A0A2V0PGW0_9CHLO|nr:bifunctional aspartate kinase homoserine dehydrogenase [Raphidocelis subcapitata]|eukprot:GBF98799.1 bifunctional aspartate kinase homoserine dehydrogenase [Raphidocelis subcapitata]
MRTGGLQRGAARQHTAPASHQCASQAGRPVRTRGSSGASVSALGSVAGSRLSAAPAAARPAGRRAALPIRAVLAEASPAAQGDGCPRGAQWIVHKFGGTCMASAERLNGAAQLVIDDPAEGKVVVVSAMGSTKESPIKVTDLILNMVARAAKQDAAFLVDLASLQEKHVAAAKELLGEGPRLSAFIARLLEDIGNLKAMLQAICIAGTQTEAFVDFVVGHGELWSAQLMALACQQLGADAVFMDTRDVLVVSPTSDGTSVDLDEPASNARLDAWFKQHGRHKIVVATGFIAKNKEGQATTLRRNGSDFSATIMGALFRSGQITIWTDVDGVYSADPRKVPEAVCLPGLTYHEAWELSYFGANVLHPRTTLPAMKYDIPITIRNYFNLDAPGLRGVQGARRRLWARLHPLHLLSESGVDLSRWREEYEANAAPADLKAFGDALAGSYIPNRAIVDCTASDAPPAQYLDWMRQGLHIVTPNKKLGSGPLAQYQAVRARQRESFIHFFYEGTVGAGLPVIATLKHLLETGDRVQRIEGIFSGTLSFIFNSFGDGRCAFGGGLLGGGLGGVAILARECGMQVELDDIPVESLVPAPLRAVPTAAEYLSRLPDFDSDMAARLKEAEAGGEVLRYVGVVDVAAGKGSVELRRYPANHPFAQLQGSDNIIAFTTARYLKQPLIVRGPGAGADVTAGGIFSDLLRLAAYLGAPS